MMGLSKRQTVLVSFMLFSLFFGAGNLIFPPFLGQNAGEYTVQAILTFCITAVILPVLGVIVVAKFYGLQNLASKVHPKFAIIYSVLIYLSIGPGLGIPRAASLPFEMAVAPYLPDGSNIKLYLFIFSLLFFIIAYWLASNPSKLVNRIGKVLTPSLLFLIVVLFVSFVFKGEKVIAQAQGAYLDNPLVKGFLEGYMTMDTIAALNFGFVISTTLASLGISDDKMKIKQIIKCGIIAGTILALVYFMLSFMGMCSSGVFSIQENGAWTLRCIVHQVFGEVGAILLAAIFTLACLTTCVGLITSCSQYFSTLTKKITYMHWVTIITVFSFLICNQGLNALLSLSVPLLDMIYPMSILLIVMGLSHNLIGHINGVYPVTIGCVGFVSVVYALQNVGITLPIVSSLCQYLPWYSLGLGWVVVAVVTIVGCSIMNRLQKS